MVLALQYGVFVGSRPESQMPKVLAASWPNRASLIDILNSCLRLVKSPTIMATQYPTMQQAARRLLQLSFRRSEPRLSPRLPQCSRRCLSSTTVAHSKPFNCAARQPSFLHQYISRSRSPCFSQVRLYKTVEQAKAVNRTGVRYYVFRSTSSHPL